MAKTWALSMIYLAAIVMLIVYKGQILAWLENGDQGSILWMLGASILFAMIPVVPYGIIAGMIGVKYGPILGGLLNVAGSSIAAEKNAFLAVLTARLIPFAPALAIHVASAVSRMSLGTFVLATVLGKIPTMFIFAIIGDRIFSWIS